MQFYNLFKSHPEVQMNQIHLSFQKLGIAYDNQELSPFFKNCNFGRIFNDMHNIYLTIFLIASSFVSKFEFTKRLLIRNNVQNYLTSKSLIK